MDGLTPGTSKFEVQRKEKVSQVFAKLSKAEVLILSKLDDDIVMALNSLLTGIEEREKVKLIGKPLLTPASGDDLLNLGFLKSHVDAKLGLIGYLRNIKENAGKNLATRI